ncbi:MAG: hypothetical protein HY394_02975 [Candidatus Diapherotrites archaeon]|nr:hypothetical protein [Candidatus Diapherotrites archaeon]
MKNVFPQRRAARRQAAARRACGQRQRLERETGEIPLAARHFENSLDVWRGALDRHDFFAGHSSAIVSLAVERLFPDVHGLRVLALGDNFGGEYARNNFLSALNKRGAKGVDLEGRVQDFERNYAGKKFDLVYECDVFNMGAFVHPGFNPQNLILRAYVDWSSNSNPDALAALASLPRTPSQEESRIAARQAVKKLLGSVAYGGYFVSVDNRWDGPLLDKEFLEGQGFEVKRLFVPSTGGMMDNILLVAKRRRPPAEKRLFGQPKKFLQAKGETPKRSDGKKTGLRSLAERFPRKRKAILPIGGNLKSVQRKEKI